MNNAQTKPERENISLTIGKLIFFLTAVISAIFIALTLYKPSNPVPYAAQDTTERSSIYAIGFYAPEVYNESEAETAAESLTESDPKYIKQYNGIREGDVITGEATFFCACAKCNGRGDGLTASGFVIENGVQSYTVSCNWLPFGTVIEIDGVEYTVRDRGGSGLSKIGRIDIFDPISHESAYERGRLKNIEINIINLP